MQQGAFLQPFRENLVDNLIATATLALNIWIFVTVISGIIAVATFVKVWRE